MKDRFKKFVSEFKEDPKPFILGATIAAGGILTGVALHKVWKSNDLDIPRATLEHLKSDPGNAYAVNLEAFKNHAVYITLIDKK